MLTSTFDTRLGQVTVSIDDGGASSTFKTLEFATIDFDFDITPDEIDIDRVSVFYGRFQIRADNSCNNEYSDDTLEYIAFVEADGGEVINKDKTDSYFRSQGSSSINDLYDRLRTNITEFTTVALTVVVDRGVDTNWEFNYKLNRGDLALSELTRKVTITGTADIDTDSIMGAFTFTDPFPFVSTSGVLYDAVGAGTFIESYVDSLNTSLTTILSRSSNISVGVDNPIYDTYDINDLTNKADNRSVAILDMSSPPFAQIQEEDIQDITQFSVAASLAASEGAVFGTGFDRNFWVYRNATGTPVTVPWDDVMNLDDIELVQAFRSVSVGTRQFSLKGDDVLPSFGITEGVHLSLQQWNRRAPKRFQFIDTPGFPFLSEGQVASKVSSVIEIITTPTADEALIIYLGAEGNTTFNAVDGDPLNTANDLALRVNNAFSGWEATVVGGVNTNPAVRVDYIGTGTGVGQNIDITKDPTGTPDMTYTITPNPTALTVNGFNANGRVVNDLRLRALQAYTKVFPVSESFKISGEMRNFIKPWETFQFSGAPSRYTGKEFRLSRASYDLFQYKLNFTAYEVNGA